MRALALILAAAAATPALGDPQTCALIAGGVVVNLIVADPATFTPPDGQTLDCSNPAAGIGSAYANGVYTAKTPAPVFATSGLTFLQFMALFTDAEQAAIVTSTDTQIKLFLTMAVGARTLDLANPEVVWAVDYLASQNLIAAPRVGTILSGAPHS